MPATIDKLIINSPYEEPKSHWSYEAKTRTFSRKEGRRPAGYVIASESSRAFDDPGIFVEIPLVNAIRPRIKAWSEHPTNPYAGATGITKGMLDHWRNAEERTNKRFFFCQLEAIETRMSGFVRWTPAPALVSGHGLFLIIRRTSEKY